MARLSMEDVAKLVVARKFAEPAVAVAVCWAESAGRTDAVNVVNNPPSKAHLSRDRGLWQINSYWHPEVNDACAFEPNCNADQTLRISSGGRTWTPWTTYNHGSHLRYMKDAQTAVNNVTLPPPPPLPPYDPWHHKYSVWPVVAKQPLYHGSGYAGGTQHLQPMIEYFHHVAIFEAGQKVDNPFSVFLPTGIAIVRNLNAFFNRDGKNWGQAVEAWNGYCGPETWKIIDFLASRWG